jgi:hypothetical protein
MGLHPAKSFGQGWPGPGAQATRCASVILVWAHVPAGSKQPGPPGPGQQTQWATARSQLLAFATPGAAASAMAKSK